MNYVKTIKFKLTALMVFALVIPLAIVGVISYEKTAILENAVIQKDVIEAEYPEFRDIFSTYENLLNELSEYPEVKVEDYRFTNTEKNNILNMPEVNSPVKEEFYQEYLTSLEKQHRHLINTYIATEKGEFYLSNIPPKEVDLTKFDPRQRDWYLKAVEAKGEIIWTEPYMDTGTGKSTITLAKTLTDNNGKVYGVIGFDFDLHEIAVDIRGEIKNSTLIVATISLLIVLISTFYFMSNLNRMLNALQSNMAKVASGDLSIEKIPVASQDELGQLTNSFNHMVANLKELVVKVIETSQNVAASAEQLSANAEETSKASEQIASSIQAVSGGAEKQLVQVSSSNELVKQISDDISTIASRTHGIADSSLNMSEKSDVGSEVIKKAVEQMVSINSNTTETGKVISLLNQKSVEIEEILTLITGIANQTNLLALNAAIEAARAGEHGKGFAVVADEVRKLAEQSSQSTQKIGLIIREIQDKTREVVESMNVGVEAVKVGTNLVSEAGVSFKDISSAVQEVSEQMKEVSHAILQINGHTESLVQSINDVSDVTVKTTSATQEVAAATEEQTASMEEVSSATRVLAEMAQVLEEVAQRFKI